jgi:hypothetical protein
MPLDDHLAGLEETALGTHPAGSEKGAQAALGLLLHDARHAELLAEFKHAADTERAYRNGTEAANELLRYAAERHLGRMLELQYTARGSTVEAAVYPLRREVILWSRNIALNGKGLTLRTAYDESKAFVQSLYCGYKRRLRVP